MPPKAKRVVSKKTTKSKGVKKKTVVKSSSYPKPKDCPFGEMDFEDEGININVYGQSGTGKTTFWGTFPGLIAVLVCSGGKRKPGELRSLNTPEMKKKVKPLDVQDSEQLMGAINWLRENSDTFATVVLDHVSGLQDMLLAEEMGIEKVPEQLSWGFTTRQTYQQVSLKLKTVLAELFDLKQNTVIVGQERIFNLGEDEVVDSEIVKPYIATSVSPSSLGWLNPAADYIVQTFKKSKTELKTMKVKGKEIEKEVNVEGVDYCLRTGPHEAYITKFRLPRGSKKELPDHIVDPSYEKIMELINGG